ncbi:MAG: hypothetical protein RLZZ403_1214 [Pseudomonadota bacterium]|jgi:hypothetical protein
MSQATQPFHARESSSAKLTATIKDETEAVIPAASLTTLTLLLYDQTTHLASATSTAAIINSRNRQDVLNTNGCTVSTGGVLTMTFSPADNIIINTGKSSERHVALFEYTYAAGAKAGKEEVLMDVYNYARTT